MENNTTIFLSILWFNISSCCLPFSEQIKRGNSSYQLELAIYTFIFGIYLICRIALYFKTKQKLTIAKSLRNIGIPFILCASFSLIIFPFSNATHTSEQIVVLTDEPVPSSTEQPVYEDGIWIGSALGYNDYITASVTISNGKIIKISIIEGNDDEPYYTWAKDGIPKSIINYQSTNIDTVSGATFSSKGIIQAVESALEKAQFFYPIINFYIASWKH